MSIDWREIRGHYPALQGRAYFNTATYGLCSRRTNEAMIAHLQRRDDLACSDFLSWFDDLDRLRAKIARLIHCQDSDIAFPLNAAACVSLLLNGLDWKPGDRIVTLTNEFPNQIYQAALLAGRGVEFVETDWAGFHEAVNERTRVVVMSQLSYSTGFRPPLEEIGPWLRSRGVLFYVDATQALGALRCDVSQIQPAMLAVDAYKWMLTPNGATFCYVSPELRRVLEPNVVGWRSDVNWRNVNALQSGAPAFSDKAEKYEGGMPAFPSLYALEASVDEYLEMGLENTESRALELTRLLHLRLEGLGGVEILHRNSPITAARLTGRDPAAVVAALRERNIFASARQGCLRLAVHFYNDESDIEALGDALGSL